MPNGFAYLVLLSWPLVTILIFRAMPIPKAIAWTIVGGYLLLPERTGFDLPILPIIDKTFIPAVSAAVMTWLTLRDPRPPRIAFLDRRGQKIVMGLLVLLLGTPFITVLTNSEPVIFGSRFIPGLTLYDALSTVNGLLVMLIPFFLARRFLATEEDHAALLKVFALAGVAYAVPAVFEVRMSPQLNIWLYGFFPHSFQQHMRGGGYRPIVFLPHGLWLAIFMAMAVLAASGLWRVLYPRGRWLFLAVVLLGVLFLLHSLGALVIALLLLPVVLLGSVAMQLRVAAILSLIILLFPVLRGVGLVPIGMIVEAAAVISEDRASSLQFRLDNEDRLLDRASRKPLAGWGGWGRPRIYDERTGEDLSITDGAWIIIIGNEGWLGYIGKFGLLTLPSILLWIRRRSEVSSATSVLALVLVANLVDLLPNATLTPLTWLVAGALAGGLSASKSVRQDLANPIAVRRVPVRWKSNVRHANHNRHH